MEKSIALVVLGMLVCAHAVLSSSSSSSSPPSPYYTCVKGASGTFTVVNSESSGVATATYEDSINATGWAYLTLTSNHSHTDYDQMYGAGFLEGAITRDIIFPYFTNLMAGLYNTSSSTKMPTRLTAWMQDNINFMNAQIKKNPTDPYWTHVYLILAQLNGLVDGYNTYTTDKSKTLTFNDLLLLNMGGDMTDLGPALNLSNIDWSDEQAVIRNYIYSSHCSCLVKLSADLSDLFAGHTTWQFFFSMTRIFKTYNLPISVKQSSNVMMFSSYPGLLSSTDDFYQTNMKLVVMETTNGVMNYSLYSALTSSAVLSWIRVMVANKMASSGQEWVSTFSKFNSGTYNNQWIVVDMKMLVPGSHLEAGALHIVEQIPGYIESADVTDILSYGYWPSYNVPFFPYIYNVSGFPYYAEKYGSFFSYQNNPRAEIFRQRSGDVANLADMKTLMRYNNYKHDNLSLGSPGLAISSRFDLVEGNPSNPFLGCAAFGGIDSKVTSATNVNNMACTIQNGPSHDNNPPFEWTEVWDSVSHMGLPRMWNFSWVDVQYSPK